MRLLACQAALATCIVQLLLTLQHCRMGVATTAAGQSFNYSQLHSSSQAKPQLVAKSLAKTVTHPFTPFVVTVQERLAMLVKQKLVKIYTIIFQKSSKRFSNINRHMFVITFMDLSVEFHSAYKIDCIDDFNSFQHYFKLKTTICYL